MGKTDTICNVMGHRLDVAPVPLMYIGPTKDFVTDTWEPRFTAMIDSVESLTGKRTGKSREKKTLKNIAGVKNRFGWAGSATQLAGESAAKVMVDERDRMENNVEKEGDPVEMADGRHETFADGQTGVFSTPTIGSIEVETNEDTGIEHWAVSDNVGSATWKLWQEGTRHEWAFKCPDCEGHFIPRMRHLKWPEGSAAEDITVDNVGLTCTQCGSLIHQKHKNWMNENGVEIAPGQWVEDGEVQGEPPFSDTYSLWTSGLASPWRDWDVMARKWLTAVASGDPERTQAVINVQFGECFAFNTESTSWEIVAAKRVDYPMGTLYKPNPIGIVAAVDVQMDRLVYGIRAFYHAHDSALVEHGEIYSGYSGTDADDVWQSLSNFEENTYDGMQIERMFIDSRYRTDKVFEFCRSHQGWAFPIVGSERTDKPLKVAKVEVNDAGRVVRGGLSRWTLNTDYFKRQVHSKINRDAEMPGQWYLPQDATDDYCKQIVAETRVIKPSGKVVWVRLRKDNHYLDVEMMMQGAAYSLQYHIEANKGVDMSGVTPGGRPVPKKDKPLKLRGSSRGPGNDWFRRR